MLYEVITKLGNPDEDPVSRLQTVMASIRATRALYEDVPSVASAWRVGGRPITAPADGSSGPWRASCAAVV